MTATPRTVCLFLICGLAAAYGADMTAAADADPHSGVYELRVYTCDPGRLDALHKRFRDHTVSLFDKHGMTNVAYFTPTEGPRSGNTLVYFLWHESKDAAADSFEAFRADPEWNRVRTESEKDARILSQPVDSTFVTLTDYSKPLPPAKSDRVYELRTYTTNDGKLDALHARFRDHTMKLFEKHGMENVAYSVPTDEPKSANTLVYLLAHKSRDAARASWKAFIDDPDWRTVFEESRSNGPLVKKVESVFLERTDYSPMPEAE